MLKRIKEENKILIMLAFFSIGIGLWGNFRQLWLESNNFSVATISKILSFASLISAISIFISSMYLKLSKIKSFVTLALFIKVLSMIALFLTNNLGYNILLRELIILDTVTENFIILSIYPLILNIKKDDKLYSKRKLVEYLFKDIGILIGGLFIGKTIFNYKINFNTCLLISILFLVLSLIIIINVKINSKEKKSKISLKYILNNKIIVIYLIYYILAKIAMTLSLGLKILMLTNKLNFSVSAATNYILIIGLLSDIIGIILLKFLTPKNDYITVTIKFGIRCILYIVAFFVNNIFVLIIAMTWSLLISTAYENIVEAPYINLIKNEFQIFFTNICYMLGMLADSFALFLAGILFNFGLNYIFGVSALFIAVQMVLAYILVYLRKNKNKNYIKGESI